ncbi:hypothetical protein JCM8097_000143 [Rhodosporidiobolus ruineniae]
MSPAGYTPVPAYPPSRSRQPHDPPTPSHDPPLLLACLRLVRPKTAIACLVGAFFVLFLFFAPAVNRSARDWRILDLGQDPTATFADLYSASQAGWEPYEPAQKGRNEPNLRSWADDLSPDCADLLVSAGELCEELEGALSGSKAPEVDLLWTWTNGSDALLRRWKAEITSTLPGRVRPGVAAVRERQTARHFREHDELRYSIRSALRAFASSSLSKIRLLTTDLPANVLYSDTLDPLPASLSENSSSLVASSRVGQLPTWLDRSLSAGRHPPFAVTHHSSIFDDSTLLPTFNSLSIESQFPNLDGLSEFLLYMNDDTFLFDNGTMTATDVGTPLLGPVFRIQTDLTADGAAPTEFAGPPDGEWASLRRANYLLDMRFGRRRRGYLAHIPKVFSAPLLREVGLIWHDELLETSTSRFRGRRTEYQLPFLATHYIIEAHREALLHAFFVGRSDGDGDGVLSLEERRQMLVELGFSLPSTSGEEVRNIVVPFPRRRTRSLIPGLLRTAGLPKPGATGIAFSSFDGFGMGVVDGERPKERWRPVVHLGEACEPADEEEARKDGQGVCELSLERCFGEGFLDEAKPDPSAEAVFRRLASENPSCGDCVVASLVGRSGTTGLSAFLPDCDSSSPPDTPIPPESLFSLSKSFSSAHLPLTLSGSSSTTGTRSTCVLARALSVRRILRYSYTLGDSSSRFVSMQQAKLTQVVLEKMRERQKRGEKLPTFLTLNDDFKNDLVVAKADQHLRRFFQQQWPDPAPYELRT